VAEVLKNALKVDFWNVRDLADKIIAVLRYPALNREMLRNCRRELRDIRWDNAGTQVREIYNKVTLPN
jgi:glycosyltransferase involved in cell wall biosynthesis